MHIHRLDLLNIIVEEYILKKWSECTSKILVKGRLHNLYILYATVYTELVVIGYYTKNRSMFLLSASVNITN